MEEDLKTLDGEAIKSGSAVNYDGAGQIDAAPVEFTLEGVVEKTL